MNPETRTALCVFVRSPQPGRHRTRLEAQVGPQLASQLSNAFLLDLVSGLQDEGFGNLVVALDGPTPDELCGLGSVEVWRQPQGPLPTRLESILDRALAQYPTVLALGADSPGLPGALVAAAVDRLQRSDAVLGPSADGGFYLLGLNRSCRGLLQQVPWSSPQLFATTRDQLCAAGFSVDVLPTWFDVDELSDLQRLHRLIRVGEVNAPRTRVAIEALWR